MSLKSVAITICPPYLRPAFDRMEKSPIGARLARGVFWSMVGSVISRGLMLVATICIARILGKTVYGELGMIRSTVGMFGVFAGFGMGLTATKHVAEFRQSDPERAGRIIGLSGIVAMGTGGVMTLCLFIFAPWLAEHTINAPHLEGVLRIGALILFISALNGAQTGALAGFESFKAIAHVNLYVGLISFPLLIAGAYWGGLTGAVWALVINLGFNWIFNHIALRREARRYHVPFSFQNCSSEWSVVWRFSLPAVLSGVLVGPVTWVCNSMLVNQTNGYAALGVYTAALQISAFIAIANFMIGQAFLPVCVLNVNKRSPRFEFINIVFPWLIGITCALPFLCVPELWASLLGNEYAGQDMLRTIVSIAISSIIIAHRQGIARNFVAKNRLWWSLLGNSVWGVTAIVCMHYFSRFDAQGRAASFTIAYCLNTIIFIPLYIKMNLCPPNILISRYTILIWLILIFSGVMGFFQPLGITQRCAIILLAYCLIMFLLRKMWVAIGVSG